MRWAFLLLCLAACAPEEWERDYGGFVPGTAPAHHTVFLVRDERTGRPLAGVRVARRPENWLDDEGDWAPNQEEKRTDEHGLVWFRVEKDGGPQHWTFHADGYAPTEEYANCLETDVDLGPGRERAGRILDPLGKPMAGVRVGYKQGCAHSPDLASAVTDEDGVFVFADIGDGDLTIEDPRCEADYLDLWTRPWTGPHRYGIAEYRAWAAATVRGRVLLPDGTPPGWAVVHVSERGPRARVDADGRFVLRGVDPYARLTVDWEEDVQHFEAVPGLDRLLRLGPPDESRPVYEVVALVRGTESSVEVHFDRPEERVTVEATLPRAEGGALQGVATLPGGSYRVAVGAPWSRYRVSERTILVDGPGEVLLDCEERPRLVIDGLDGFDGLDQDPKPKLRVMLADRHWHVAPDDPGYVPADAAAWLRVRVDGQDRVFPIEAASGGERRVHLSLPGVKRIEFPGLKDFWAELLCTRIHVDDRVIETRAVGEYWLAVVDEERGRALAKVDLPWTAAEPLRPRLSFEAPPPVRELRVVDHDGAPVAASVKVFYECWPPGSDVEREQVDPEEGGTFRSRRFRDGVPVLVGADGFATAWFRLAGDGPYELRYGGAAIELDLRDLDWPNVLCGGVVYELDEEDDGRLRLRGLEPGPLPLIVGADGRVARIHRVVLEEGETRRIKPRLRRRAEED